MRSQGNRNTRGHRKPTELLAGCAKRRITLVDLQRAWGPRDGKGSITRKPENNSQALPNRLCPTKDNTKIIKEPFAVYTNTRQRGHTQNM